MAWALYFHPESDSLFWSEEWPEDGLCEDVTGIAEFHDAAEKRGLKCPGKIESKRIEKKTAEVTSKPFTVASAIIGSQQKWDRKPADFYPTPVDATEVMIDAIKALRTPDGRPIKRIWEPACGDGRMARVLEYHGFEVVATDLREYSGYGVGGLDFLTEDPLEKWGWDIGPIDLIMSNPPFKVAEAFIRRALSLCPNVMMLLKSQYWHAASRADLFKGQTPSVVFPLTWRPSFLEKERGTSPLMDVIWTVWSTDHIAEDPAGRGYCVFEPVRKKAYPGYSERGLKAAMQILEGELVELTEAAKLLREKNG